MFPSPNFWIVTGLSLTAKNQWVAALAQLSMFSSMGVMNPAKQYGSEGMEIPP